MHLLISNDDGVEAPGIRVLAEALSALGKVTVVAPDRDRSGASNSLTLDQPIRVSQLENGFFRVVGTPTDCVHLALCGLLPDDPDIVVSGINNTANLGDDVIYSGTVAAAMEGRYLGLPAIAVSLAAQDGSPVTSRAPPRLRDCWSSGCSVTLCRRTPSSTSMSRIARGAKSPASRSPASATGTARKPA